MHRLLAGFVSANLFFSAATAKAADLSLDAAPMFNWTGLYVGVQGGYQWSKDRSTEFFTPTGAATGFSQDFQPDGGFGGVHVGYNYQFDWLVLGIEGDADFGRASDGFTCCGGIFTFDARKNWEASIRGRIGVTPTDRLLLYVTGGAAFTDLKYSWNSIEPLFPGVNANVFKTGWTVGGGGEVAVTDRVTARLEYRYSDFGTTRFEWIDGSYEQHPRFHTARTGVSLKF
ncbi:Outer membrane protein [Mesorhizobium metallidurans STM 2683]|uniref:Outer membrane protein n=1 Tax=Mesorhizobium metallidurans STM 2683 TaxID=1297569 RepID=M5ETC6_9HYPH|nr:outer membrane protein [Mesorhizobium metallidurans]CCV07265.1 Outer membrane protein [Mesorhizobium metallidurans STM 2683]